MVCRIAYLIHTPEIKEVTEEEVHGYFQTLLVPTYEVHLDYDFGPCCGWEWQAFPFATKVDAKAFVDDLYANKHKWIKYNPDLLED